MNLDIGTLVAAGVVALIVKLVLDLAVTDLKDLVQRIPYRVVDAAASLMDAGHRETFRADWFGVLNGIKDAHPDRPTIRFLRGMRQGISLLVHINSIRADWGSGPSSTLISIRRSWAFALVPFGLLYLGAVVADAVIGCTMPLAGYAYWGGGAIALIGVGLVAWKPGRIRSGLAWLGTTAWTYGLLTVCPDTPAGLKYAAAVCCASGLVGILAREFGSLDSRPLRSLASIGVPLVHAVREVQLVWAHGLPGSLGNAVVAAVMIALAARLVRDAQESVAVPV